MKNLANGQEVDFKRDNPNLKRFLIDFEWIPAWFLCGSAIDIDVSAICMDNQGRYEGIVSCFNMKHSSAAIKHYGDSLKYKHDSEKIEINLEKMPETIDKISIAINVHKKSKAKLDFFIKVKTFNVRVCDLDSGKDLIQYAPKGNFKYCNGIFVADIYRYEEGWKFQAVGQGVKVKKARDMTHIRCKI